MFTRRCRSQMAVDLFLSCFLWIILNHSICGYVLHCFFLWFLMHIPYSLASFALTLAAKHPMMRVRLNGERWLCFTSSHLQCEIRREMREKQFTCTVLVVQRVYAGSHILHRTHRWTAVDAHQMVEYLVSAFDLFSFWFISLFCTISKCYVLSLTVCRFKVSCMLSSIGKINRPTQNIWLSLPEPLHRTQKKQCRTVVRSIL